MSSIQRLVEKIKGFRHFEAPNLHTIPDDLFLGLIIILVAFGSFGLGRLSKIQGSKTPVRIENAIEASAVESSSQAGTSNQSASVLNATASGGDLVGSKNGTKYYYSWCSGVKSINPSNLVHFTSKSEAEARGYTPSTTCKGL